MNKIKNILGQKETFDNEDTIYHLQYNQKLPFQYLIFSELGSFWFILCFIATDRIFDALIAFVLGYIWVYRWFMDAKRLDIYDVYLLNKFSILLKLFKEKRKKKCY